MRVLVVQPWISYRGSQAVSLVQTVELQKIVQKASIVCLYVDWENLDTNFKKINFILPPKFWQKLFRKSQFLLAILSLPTLFLLVLVNSKKFEILNPHNLPASWICAAVSLFVPVKVVWTVHGVPQKAAKEAPLFEKLIWFLATSWLDKLAVKKVEQIISVSEKVAKEVKARYTRKAEVLYPPINLKNKAKKSSTIRKQLGLKNSDFLLVHISYLHPAKNVVMSIETFKNILLQIPDAKLLILGAGPQKKELENLVRKLNLGTRVYFVGFIQPENLVNFYKACDLVLAPFYKTEGCPLVILEAAAVGKISIVAKGSGADEIVEKYNIGIVARPNPGDFAKAVIGFYQNREFWSKRELLAKNIVRRHFSGKVYAKKFLNLISHL